jgi:uncharacterized phage-like protein YoqJ
MTLRLPFEGSIVGVTGHRLKKFRFYDAGTIPRVKRRLKEEIIRLRPRELITGMATGVDQWTADIAIELSIPFIAAVPFNGQELKWDRTTQRHYHYLLKLAKQVVIVSPGPYAREKMDRRNEWIVDHSDLMLAVWNGLGGGTANTVHYARERRREVIRINPSDTSKMYS